MKKISLIILNLMLAASVAVAGGYRIGDKANDFKLKNVDGSIVSLADFEDAKGFIIVFTCNHCPMSKKYEGRIIDLDKKYIDLGYPVIAINPNDDKIQPADSYDKMVELAEKHDYKFPYLHDGTQDVAMEFGATRTPHAYILQKVKNDFIVQYIGAIDNNYKSAELADEKYVEDAVDALLEGEEVPITYTTAVGCTIKWAK
ncbi:MAG: thioredoxin family protein [Bacteroidota bacterium]